MALTSGTRIGGYEIRGSLGAGGMGDVYRARDSKLNRDVALKISTSGGFMPQWHGDGEEISFIAPDNRLMAVPVRLDASGTAVDAGTPVALFLCVLVRPTPPHQTASDS